MDRCLPQDIYETAPDEKSRDRVVLVFIAYICGFLRSLVIWGIPVVGHSFVSLVYHIKLYVGSSSSSPLRAFRPVLFPLFFFFLFFQRCCLGWMSHFEDGIEMTIEFSWSGLFPTPHPPAIAHSWGRRSSIVGGGGDGKPEQKKK